ncbi:MAG: ribose-phosphate pyrophosphokinase [Cyanobacteria bacterium J06621_12]
MTGNFKLFAGTANPQLAQAVADELNISLGECKIERFPDGEISVRLAESVREQKVFILQPTSPPVDTNLMELLAFADACRHSSAAQITAVVPYFGYARSDKRQGKRQAIMASLAANLIEAAGINHLITCDLHAPQIEGFFRIPIDNLSAVKVLLLALNDSLPPETVVVSPDSGRIPMAMEFARGLNANVAVLHKQRENGRETHVTHIIGNVKDKPCLIIDDMISTGGTIATTINALHQAYAKPQIYIAATHGVLIQNAEKNLSHRSVRDIFITDTISAKEMKLQLQPISIAPLIAQAILNN